MFYVGIMKTAERTHHRYLTRTNDSFDERRCQTKSYIVLVNKISP